MSTPKENKPGVKMPKEQKRIKSPQHAASLPPALDSLQDLIAKPEDSAHSLGDVPVPELKDLGPRHAGLIA